MGIEYKMNNKLNIVMLGYHAVLQNGGRFGENGHQIAAAQKVEDDVYIIPAISPNGKTALIIGTGDIGSHFARLCKNVGMTTIGIRRNPAVEAPGIDHMVGFDSLDDVLQYADVIAMCVPSTPTTYHLLNAERIASLKPDAIIINAGRGDAIESQALADALAEGRIHGAALDVTEPEPLPADSPLWCEPKCLITPHVAGGNHLEITERSIISIALGNVRCYANGQSLDNRMPIKS